VKGVDENIYDDDLFLSDSNIISSNSIDCDFDLLPYNNLSPESLYADEEEDEHENFSDTEDLEINLDNEELNNYVDVEECPVFLLSKYIPGLKIQGCVMVYFFFLLLLLNFVYFYF
jgi:hypothetical protein